MRRRLALLSLILAGGFGSLAANPALAAPARLACGGEYVSAHLTWGNKCLRTGEFCKVGNREYARYGFYCPTTGHLRRR